MKKCIFIPALKPGFYGPPRPMNGYVLSDTWIVAKWEGTRPHWQVYHAPTGAYAGPSLRTKRHGEWLAVAWGEVPPFVEAKVRWARAQWELEDAQKALERAKKKAEKEATSDGST